MGGEHEVSHPSQVIRIFTPTLLIVFQKLAFLLDLASNSVTCLTQATHHVTIIPFDIYMLCPNTSFIGEVLVLVYSLLGK